jgi:hypothetical protein
MEILEKTATKLHIRDDRRHDFRSQIVLACFLPVFSVLILLKPSQMELNCHRNLSTVNCHVVNWNALNLHSKTQNIQLYAAKTIRGGTKSGPKVLLKTSEGEMESPESYDAYQFERAINDFLNHPTSTPSFQAKISLHWLTYIFVSMFFPTAFFGSWITLFRFPIETNWELELDADQIYPDRQCTSGKIHGTFQGLVKEWYVQYEFSEVKTLITRQSRRGCYVSFKLKSGKTIPLSPLGFSTSKSNKITQAISEILEIPAS